MIKINKAIKDYSDEKVDIKICVGSWKAYNEDNERALGSDFIDLSVYDTKEKIIKELKSQGFTDEELEETFIQDKESNVDFPSEISWDNTTFNEMVELYNKIKNQNPELVEAVARHELLKSIQDMINIDYTDYYYTKGSLEKYARNEIRDILGKDIMDWLEDYIDFEAYADKLTYENNFIEETENGVVFRV